MNFCPLSLLVQSGTPRFAQPDVDQWINENMFYKRTGGFYLELGALDGEMFSNTAQLARYAGWRGLLIEPNPTSFAKLALNRPESINVNAAICSRLGQVHFVEHAHPAMGGVWEFISLKNRQFNFPHITDENLAQLSTLIPCVPLSWILER